MPVTTTHLSLTLPGFGEYRDSWWEPLNDNFQKIDDEALAISNEITDARQSMSTLLEYLQVGHEPDGSLKATPEVTDARNSAVYGHRDPVSNTLFSLVDRLNQVDLEMWKAREGRDTLLDALAFREFAFGNMILSGTKNLNGYPSWMGFTGANVNVNGSAEAIYFLIDGKLGRVRTSKDTTLSGSAGVKYIYAQYMSDGDITVDGDSSTPPPVTATGVTSADVNSEMTLFTDASIADFTAEDVQPGDILEILTGGDAGRYIIKEVAPGGNIQQLKIAGLFPVGGLSSINYVIRDRQAVTLGFDTAETPAAGKIYIGEADWDGVAVTAVRPRHFKDVFVSEWRPIDVTSPTTFTEIFQHGLGSDVLDVSVQVSQADDGSATVEELSMSRISSTLAFTPSNGTLAVGVGTLAVGVGTLGISNTLGLTAGDQTLTGTVTLTGSPALTGAPGLTGTVGGSIGGSVQMDRSVVCNWDKNKVRVKNAHSGVFYKDYSDVVRTSGFLRVVVRKRG